MLQRFINDIKRFGHYTLYAARSELRAEVAGSYLNWLWWILEPFCFMLVYTFVFGYMFAQKQEYFPIFVFIGLTFWQFFDRLLMSSVRLVKNNKSIVAKVYLPKFTLILVKILVNGFKMLISFAIVFAMMIVFRVPLTPNILWLPLIILLHILITFAFCSVLLHFGVYVEDLANVLRIGLRLLFYVTGIFYNIESKLPGQWGKFFNRCNPAAFVMSSARDCLLYGKAPSLKWMIAWFIAGILILILGIRLIYKNENSYVKVI